MKPADEQRLAALMGECRLQADQAAGGLQPLNDEQAQQIEEVRTRQVSAIAAAIRRGATESQPLSVAQGGVAGVFGRGRFDFLTEAGWRPNNGAWVAAAAALVLFVGAGALALGGAFAESASGEVASISGPSLKQVVGTVVVSRQGRRDRVLRENSAVAQGDELRTTAGASAGLELGEGARVELSSATTVEMALTRFRDERLVLKAGRVDVSVPQLPPEQTRMLEVRTADVRVVVRGTIFSVEVVGEETQVGVSRGSVSVFHEGREHRVRAGEHWSSDGTQLDEGQREEGQREDGQLSATVSKVGKSRGPRAGAVETGVGEAAQAAAVGRRRSRTQGIGRSKREVLKASGGIRAIGALQLPEAPESQEMQVSNLSQQNRLFGLGVTARNEQNDKRAVFWFQRLRDRYPDGPLAQSAARELKAARQRLVKKTTK